MRLPHYLVTLQFALAAGLVLTTRGAWRLDSRFAALGWCWVLAGLVIAVWAWITMGLFQLKILPQLRDDARLLTRGPYAWVRHPMYTGLLLALAGLLVLDGRLWRVVGWAALVVVLTAKSQIEEQHLEARFAEAYHAYRARTGRFWPKLK